MTCRRNQGLKKVMFGVCVMRLDENDGGVFDENDRVNAQIGH